MRYAIYFTPARDHPLTRAAAAWLGRDAFVAPRAIGYPPEDIEPLDAMAWTMLTADPRRYGFHATIVAPFHLAEGRSESGLLAALETLAPGVTPFELPLRVAALGSFLALVPAEPVRGLDEAARQAVLRLAPFRAPLTAEERARRRPESLSPRQRELLDQHGYPYVMEEFRFHMTLTGSIPDPERREAIRAMLARRFAALLETPLAVDRLAVFRQAAPELPFTVMAEQPIGIAPSRPGSRRAPRSLADLAS